MKHFTYCLTLLCATTVYSLPTKKMDVITETTVNDEISQKIKAYPEDEISKSSILDDLLTKQIVPTGDDDLSLKKHADSSGGEEHIVLPGVEEGSAESNEVAEGDLEFFHASRVKPDFEAESQEILVKCQEVIKSIKRDIELLGNNEHHFHSEFEKEILKLKKEAMNKFYSNHAENLTMTEEQMNTMNVFPDYQSIANIAAKFNEKYPDFNFDENDFHILSDQIIGFTENIDLNSIMTLMRKWPSQGTGGFIPVKSFLELNQNLYEKLIPGKIVPIYGSSKDSTAKTDQDDMFTIVNRIMHDKYVESNAPEPHSIAKRNQGHPSTDTDSGQEMNAPLDQIYPLASAYFYAKNAKWISPLHTFESEGESIILGSNFKYLGRELNTVKEYGQDVTFWTFFFQEISD